MTVEKLGCFFFLNFILGSYDIAEERWQEILLPTSENIMCKHKVQMNSSGIDERLSKDQEQGNIWNNSPADLNRILLLGDLGVGEGSKTKSIKG